MHSITRSYQGKNRRGQQRFALSRKMVYRMAGHGRQSAWKQGVVIDMSATGIRVETGNPLPSGVQIDLVIDWPGIYHGREEVRLFLSGTVCRSGPDWAALQITDHDFRFAPGAISTPSRAHGRSLAVA